MESEKIHEPPAYSGPTGQANTFVRPHDRRLHDSSVTFEEYYYFAQRLREEENATAPVPTKATVRGLFSRTKAVEPHASAESSPPAHARKASLNVNLSDRANRLEISDEEWANASRMLRTATWGACFYLITTDILVCVVSRFSQEYLAPRSLCVTG